MKCNLGISITLLACIIYSCGIFSGYTALILLGGYVLIVEKNDWLRYVAIKAMLLSIVFSAIYAVIGLLPDVLGLLAHIASLFNGSFTYLHVSIFMSILYDVLGIAKVIAFLMLAWKALSMKDVPMPVVDKLISKLEQ